MGGRESARSVLTSKEKKVKTFLLEVTRVDIDTLNLNETILATAVLDLAVGKYAQLGLEVPEGIADRLVRLNRELELKVRDQRMLELRELERENVGLMTKEEKRAKNEARQAQLKAALGIARDTPAPTANAGNTATAGTQ